MAGAASWEGWHLDAQGRPVREAEPVRRCLQRVRLVHGYTDRSRELRILLEDVQHSHVVTSRTQSKRHAPALDIDHPAVLVRHEGEVEVWLDHPIPERQLRRLHRHLERTGLGTRTPVAREWHTETWESRRGEVLDLTGIDETLSELGREARGTFEALHDVTTAAVGERTWAGPQMENPTLLRFACPVRLVSSGRYSHLYVDGEVQWPSYRRLLKLLWRAGVIEKEWLKLSLHYEHSSVRLPWITKDW